MQTLIIKQRPLRPRRADMIIVPREMELERQTFVRARSPWFTRGDVRDFATTFTLCFTAALIFFN